MSKLKDNEDRPMELDRRTVMLGGAAAVGAGAVGGLGCKRKASAVEKKVKPEQLKAKMKYRTLGRTGLRISEICFGCVPFRTPSVLSYAIDCGINFIDVAHIYQGGQAEESVGKVMKKRRREVVLATKIHPRMHGSKKDIIKSAETSLKRLQTNHVDLLQLHVPGTLAEITAPHVKEAFTLLKKQGKARFFGVTSHAPSLMQVLGGAIKDGFYDSIMAKYSFMDYPGQMKLFKEAGKKRIGVIAMKTLGGAKHQRLDKFKDSTGDFSRSAIRWALSNPHVSTVAISIANFDQVRQFGLATWKKLCAADQQMLKTYASAVKGEFCSWCGECHGACPHGINVSDHLRHLGYYEDYGQEALAMGYFQSLARGKGPDRCAGCSAPCESKCPSGVQVSGLMARAAMHTGTCLAGISGDFSDSHGGA